MSVGSGDLLSFPDGELFVEPAYLEIQRFLSIRSTKYRFPVQLKKRISFTLQLTNKTDEHVAFRVLVTNVKNYRANPNRGIVLPGTTCDIAASMQAPKEAPHDMPFEDMIILQSFIAPKGATGEDITSEMFEDGSGKVVEEFEFRVIFVPADPLVGSGEGSAARASGVDNRNQKLYSPDPLHVSLSIPDGDLFIEPGEIISQDLLSIRPTKYRFPVQSKECISFSLQLTNKTDEYVAFKVKASNVMKYRASPFRDIILPGTACDITVSMQAPMEAPHDMPFEDMILLQSFRAPKGATGKDITPEMFDDETGKVVEEFELWVIYVPADPLVPKSSGEGSSARAFGLKNGNQNFYLLDHVAGDGLRQRNLQNRSIMA